MSRMDILIFSWEVTEDNLSKSSLKTQSELSIDLKKVSLTKKPSIRCRTFTHSKHSLRGSWHPCQQQ